MLEKFEKARNSSSENKFSTSAKKEKTTIKQYLKSHQKI